MKSSEKEAPRDIRHVRDVLGDVPVRELGEPSQCNVSLTTVRRKERKEVWVRGVLAHATVLTEFWQG